MIIRYGGGNSGIKEYLEGGRKADRHFSRDELDKRIPLEGDLDVTQAAIDSIQDKGQERYLHISMSFNEPDVSVEKMQEVFDQYKADLMHAYGDDEFNVYAEVHWPRIKEAYNYNTEKMEARYPHIHIVIPKKNLLTGGFLNPTGMHEKSVKYLDAIQEKLNRDNGLSSPRENPRVGTNHYESALGKYKDKEFKTKNGALKESIFKAVCDRDVRSESEFKNLLSEYGEVAVRNAGKPNQYFAVKVQGDKKFTNLKANIFARPYLEDRALVIEPLSDSQVQRRVETWRDVQSKEIKYVSNASTKVKSEYRGLSLPERREFLQERATSYDKQYRQAASNDHNRAALSGLRQGNHQLGDLEFAAGSQATGTGHLHELRASNVDHFGAEGSAAYRLFLSRDEDDDVQLQSASGGSGLRHNLYAGRSGGLEAQDLALGGNPRSSVVGALVDDDNERRQAAADLQKFADIRKNLDPQHLLAYVQIRYGVDPGRHKITTAKDGSPRIRAGKYNYNVSDFLTKHVGLSWSDTSSVLTDLYEKQQSGIVDRPKSQADHVEDWRKFRADIYPTNIRTYQELKSQISISYTLGLKAINSEYFTKRKQITKDESLTRFDRHYLRSVVILDKLQKLESLQDSIKEQNALTNRVKYPYSTLFYDYATKNEEISMKILDDLKRRYTNPAVESENSIGSSSIITPDKMPSSAEALKRAALVAKLRSQSVDETQKRLKLADLRPRPLASGAVAFCHSEHGKQIFVNHPDRLEMNKATEPDEVEVGLTYAVERFGSPLDIKGTKEFKNQVIAVAAERQMDIQFTDEGMNKALEAKRAELGLEPVQGNSMSAAELEVDKSLPLPEGVDKALLQSKLAELAAINAARAEKPINPAEQALADKLLDDAAARHDEVRSGFIGDAEIERIAQDDLQDFAYLEGKPEQQDLARSMATVIDNPAYSAYMDREGPQELRLTVHAATVMQASLTPAQAAKEARKEADMAKLTPDDLARHEEILEQHAVPPLTFTHDGKPVTLDLDRFTQKPAEPLTFVHEGKPAVLDLDRFTVPEFDEQMARQDLHDRWVNQRIENIRSGFGGQADEMKALAVDNPERDAWIDGQIEAMKEARQPGPVQEAAKEPQVVLQPTFMHEGKPAVLDLDRFTQKPAEPLQFTHEGRPVELDLDRYRKVQVPGELIDDRDLAPGLKEKVLEMHQVNAEFAHEDKASIDRIMRRVTLTDAVDRHKDFDPAASPSKMQDLARQDIAALKELDRKPEKQALALSVSTMMVNEHYKAYMDNNGPDDLGVTIEAAQVVNEQIQQAQPDNQRSDHDMDN